LVELDDTLSHHGVKGMHWGSHLQKSLDLHTKVAAGKGSILERYRVGANMSALDHVRHKGSVVSYAKEHSAELQGRKDRFEAGTETAGDKAARLATYSAFDFIKAHGNDKKRAALLGHSDFDLAEAFIEDFFEHHGVKGQRWGVTRKISEIRAHRETARRAGNSEDANRARDAELKAKNAKHGTKALSNKELQDLVTRMNLEQQLSNLKDKQPSKFQTGQKVIKTALATGKTANDVIAFAKSPAGQALKTALEKEIKKAKLA
jgi:hypothetical protein